MDRYSPETYSWIETRTIENLIYIYQKELAELHRTGYLPKKVTVKERKNLVKNGVLSYKRKRPAKCSLTLRALKIMEAL